ncbi:MAG: phage portal protein, partial [Sciscionella sp.]
MAKQEKKSGLWSSLLGAVGLELRSNPTEKRSSLENPQTPLSYPAEWLLDIFNGGRTDSGLRVSEMTALQVVTVFQCVNIIANGIAAHPLNVYRRINTPDGPVGKEIAYDHPLYDILNTEPNPEMTSATWRRTMQCHKLLWGNAFSEIERDNSNRISAVWPRNPARTRPVRLLSPMTYQGDLLPAGTLMYETFEAMKDSQIMEQDSLNQHAGFRRLVLAEDMLHFVGLSLDGRLGSDVIVLSRQAIGLSLAAEKYGAKFFGNGAVPQGILG